VKAYIAAPCWTGPLMAGWVKIRDVEVKVFTFDCKQNRIKFTMGVPS
jgi:hypothetical protein